LHKGLKIIKKTFIETISVQGLKAKNLSYHQSRLNQTISSNFGTDHKIDLQNSITPPDTNFYRCRVIYDTKIIKIEYLPYVMKKLYSFKVLESNIEYPYKNTNRAEIDELLSKKEDCDEIIIAKNGLLRDTSIANIAIFKNNRWQSPHVPLLKGTMRAKLLDEKKIITANLTIDDLKKAKRFAIMNAMIGFVELQKFYIKPI